MLTDDTERKVNITIKAIRDVGFPIVVACFLIYFGVQWADRLLVTQERFTSEVTDNYKQQTKVMEGLLDLSEKQGENVSKIVIGQENTAKSLEYQAKILDKSLEYQTKILELMTKEVKK